MIILYDSLADHKYFSTLLKALKSKNVGKNG